MRQTDGIGAVTGVPIRIDEVTVEYASAERNIHALGPVSLSIQPGEFVSVVGPSGCGKSTLLKVVSGLIEPTSGHVRIADTLVKGPWPRLGVVFQSALLMDWRTVLGNVLLQAEMHGMPKGQAESKARSLLRQAGLEGFEKHRPFELSGGMQQRVGICRALLHDPPLIIMDEPFGALDALTREQMSYDLQTLWMGRRPTVLFITHSISEATLLSDRVVVMSSRPGRILAEFEMTQTRPRRLSEGEDLATVEQVSREIRRLLASGHGDGGHSDRKDSDETHLH